jgi:hypothetical protein
VLAALKHHLMISLLALLLPTLVVSSPAAAQPAAKQTLRQFAPADLARFGIRRIPGKHVTLYTDLPRGAEVDGLPKIFDAAFGQWCRYFGRDPAKLAAWHMNGFVMKEKAKFQANGMLLGDLPDFPNGYSRGNEFWLYEQKSDYYRRHLFLHEGTHGFMFHVFGSCGPPWYMEGMAELLGTHKLAADKLQLLHFPQNREEVPYLGRIKLVKDDVARGKTMTLDQIMAFDGRAHRRTEAYAWCWAATVFLSSHPAYRDRFASLYELLPAKDFNRRVRATYAADWNKLAIEWREFAETIEYGHDIPRTVIEFGSSEPVPAAGKITKLRTDAGWQNSGFKLEAGQTYRIRGKGRFQIAGSDPLWSAEPGGVTIRYWRGRPLGMLLGAVITDKGLTDKSGSLAKSFPIGLDHTLTAKHSGTLYLKVNDSPAELADNTGTLQVHVVPVATKIQARRASE